MNPATTDSDRSEPRTAVAAPNRVVIASAYGEHHRARLEALEAKVAELEEKLTPPAS